MAARHRAELGGSPGGWWRACHRLSAGQRLLRLWPARGQLFVGNDAIIVLWVITYVKSKYTRDQLVTAVARSTSLSGVLRELGFDSYSGAMHNHIKKLLVEYGIDTAHFLGFRSNLGKPP